MTHFRTAIRAAAVALLKEATAAEERVFDSRLDVLGKNNLPAIKVYTSEDAGGVRELGADGAQSRSVTMIIECVIANHDDDEDDADFAARIDDLSGEVEAAIEADPTLGGVCADAAFEGVSTAPSAEGDLATYLATLSYRVEAWNVGVQLPGGRLAVVKADTVAIGRLRSWSVEIGGEIVDATHSLDEWRRFTPSEVASWSATLVMTLDDSDAGQALLAAQSVHEFEIYPRGEAGGAWVGGAIVASIDEGVTDGGDVVRTVTISGNAGLIR